MYIFGIAQLSSIHLGHDRNFTMLIYNANPTKVKTYLLFLIFYASVKFQIDGSLCTCDLERPIDLIGQQFEFTLTHMNDAPNNKFYEWNVTIDATTSTETNWFEIGGKIQRTSEANITDFKV